MSTIVQYNDWLEEEVTADLTNVLVISEQTENQCPLPAADTVQVLNPHNSLQDGVSRGAALSRPGPQAAQCPLCTQPVLALRMHLLGRGGMCVLGTGAHHQSLVLKF